MATGPHTYLPSELVHAILLRTQDKDSNHKPLKRGLTACSLTCRRWAALIRPMLFEELALRSGEDVSQLVAFMDADVQKPALKDCIRSLTIVDDVGSERIPWSHQLMMLHTRLSFLIEGWTVKDATPNLDAELLLNHRSPLPFTILPRTLPGR